MTLTELMIAVLLIGIGIMGSVGAFNSIQKSIQYDKARTLAANLAQEKMQIVMQKSYFEVLVTTYPAYDAGFSPALAYDPTYFPPETIQEGSISFRRLTYVQVVQEASGKIMVLPPNTPDTGMRQVTVSVIWQQGSDRRFHSIQNVLNNPNTIMASAVIKGRVTDAATGAGIPSSVVDAAENVGWRDDADNAGNYFINLAPGTFNFRATAQGYFSKSVPVAIAPSATVTQNFSLTAIATGTVRGTAWLNTHLLISQVVASTGVANDIEYVELYNPTTGYIYIGDNAHNGDGSPMPAYVPVLWGNNNASYNARHLYYANNGVGSYSFFLIANTGNADPATACANFVAHGNTVSPDACWRHDAYSSGGNDHVIQCGGSCPGNNSPDAGGVTLLKSAGLNASFTLIPGWASAIVDTVGWNQKSFGGNFAPSNAVEGLAINTASNNGLQPEEQIVRASQPGMLSSGVGRAYDSNSNNLNFFDLTTLSYQPYNTSNTLAPLAGTPAAGAIVSIADGLSTPSSATLTGIPPYAQFTIPRVATGTWSVFIDSGNASVEIDTVTVTALTMTSIPNAGTTPAWPSVGVYSAFLSSSGVVGTVSGHVTNVAGGVISPSIVVNIAGVNTLVGATGAYSLRLPVGTYDVTANPGLGNANYETEVQPGVLVTLGDVTANVDFVLSQGGKVSGWLTRDGTNPLPGVSVVALDSLGQAHDTEVSGANGVFLLVNLTTGSYTIQPVLESKENANPITSAVTVSAGNTVSAGTFTVTGAMGTVTGTATAGGQLIKTGVLVVVSTAAVTAPPPILNIAALTGAGYYAGSTKEDGTYSIDVRGSSTTVYNIAGFYMRLNGQTPMISSNTVTNVTVTAGATSAGNNFSW